MAKTGIGVSLRRLEDQRLLRGEGRYSDDFQLPGQGYAVVVRSPYAHARIVSIDRSAACKMPGVLLVLTGADVLAGGLKPMPFAPEARSPPDIRLDNHDGSPHRIVRPHILAIETARFVGEAVAFVVAATLAEAKDAAEALEVTYKELPPIDEIAIDSMVGDWVGVEAEFGKAAHVVRIETKVQRVTGVPMEPRSALAAYDPASARYTLYAGGDSVVRPKSEIALILGIAPDQLRVIAHDVGGNFGTRYTLFPEFALVCWAAKKVGRPVKWTCERREAFASDYAGRDCYFESELALDSEGNFLALRSSSRSNLGAYTASFVPLTKGTQLSASLYRMPAAVRALAVMTNTQSTAPYRSAGRPEVMFVIERLIDKAARQASFDRLELRRRNLITATPHTNSFGITFDSGDYADALEQVLELTDWTGYAARRQASFERGLRRGLGLAGYVESQSGAPNERAEVSVKPEGEVEIVIGTLSAGQGHATSFAQLASEWLGVPADRVRVYTSDTDQLRVGGGSHSGRSIRFASLVIHKASQGIIAKGLRLAARELEVSETDLTFKDSCFMVEGTNRSIGLFELAARHGAIASAADVESRIGSYPYGWHVCEVEVDAETGVVRVDRYTTIDDVGRAVNPLILHGQTHGGIAQGIGQALMEQCFYDEYGQLVSGSFMDYAMPRADDFPAFHTALSEVPSTSHPLGLRGGGEGGITPALAVVINAVVDALAEFGVTHIDMPASPERVWRAIQTAHLATQC
jgi:aerobic carbon-monoxide dehydrogenase large subunit